MASTTVICLDSEQIWMPGRITVGTSVDFALSSVCECLLWTFECESILMVDSDDSGAVTADLIVTLSTRSDVALNQPLTSWPWNLQLSTHTCKHLLIGVWIRLIWPLSNSDNYSSWPRILQRGIFSVIDRYSKSQYNKIFNNISRTASYMYQLDAQFRWSGDLTIHSLDSKF